MRKYAVVLMNICRNLEESNQIFMLFFFQLINFFEMKILSIIKFFILFFRLKNFLTESKNVSKLRKLHRVTVACTTDKLKSMCRT